MPEHITHDESHKTAWICVCGNTPVDAGFFPCNEKGEEVEPTPEEWKIPLYVCDSCGRIINKETLEVVGKKIL